MKKIEAIIRPSRFEEVKQALSNLGIGAFTVCDVRGGVLGARKGCFTGARNIASMCCRRSRSKWWWERAWQTR